LRVVSWSVPRIMDNNDHWQSVFSHVDARLGIILRAKYLVCGDRAKETCKQ
jgi:hypothetical protein